MLRFLTAGSVDDGKSTLVGRLLHDSRAVYEDQLEALQGGNGLDLALLTDGLRAEREQGITIDVAYRYFSTARRQFVLADAPGHEQYTRNMAVAASNADLAVILLDVRKGVLPQTRRHACIARLLGIRRFVVAVNKMDLVDYGRDRFEPIAAEFARFSGALGLESLQLIPVSALRGDNVVERSARMSWYEGPSLLDLLEEAPAQASCREAPVRAIVQMVLRANPDFRGYAAWLASGELAAGQPLLVLPSRHITRLRSLESLHGARERAAAPTSVTLRLEDEVDLGRGDMLASPEAAPCASSRFVARLVWMSEAPLEVNRPFLLRHAARQVCASATAVIGRTDLNTLAESPAETLHLNDIGTARIETHHPLYFDPYEHNRATGSFLLIDPITNQTAAAGMIERDDSNGGIAAAPAAVPTLAHAGLVVWFTGLSSSGKTTICRGVYEKLWACGLRVEMLDGDEVRKHLSKDLGFSKADRDENIRRIGFVASLLSRNGVVVLASAISPYRSVRAEVRAAAQRFLEVYVNAPLELCEQRDPKGIYARARRGQLRGVTGIDDPYEPPEEPEVECRTDRESVQESVAKVLAEVRRVLEL